MEQRTNRAVFTLEGTVSGLPRLHFLTDEESTWLTISFDSRYGYTGKLTDLNDAMKHVLVTAAAVRSAVHWRFDHRLLQLRMSDVTEPLLKVIADWLKQYPHKVVIMTQLNPIPPEVLGLLERTFPRPE